MYYLTVVIIYRIDIVISNVYIFCWIDLHINIEIVVFIVNKDKNTVTIKSVLDMLEFQQLIQCQDIHIKWDIIFKLMKQNVKKVQLLKNWVILYNALIKDIHFYLCFIWLYNFSLVHFNYRPKYVGLDLKYCDKACFGFILFDICHNVQSTIPFTPSFYWTWTKSFKETIKSVSFLDLRMWLIELNLPLGFELAWPTRRLPYMEQKLLTFIDHLKYLPGFFVAGVCVAQS